MNNTIDLKFTCKTPDAKLVDFVSSFWSLENPHNEDTLVTILPDGYFDVLFNAADHEPFQCMLFGLATKPADYIVPARSRTFSISFKLPAAEHILMRPIAEILDKFEVEPPDSKWLECLSTASIEDFVVQATRFLTTRLEQNSPAGNLTLFRQLYASNGNIKVSDLSERSEWKSRQVNRYFQTYFGLPLKAYCNILRFRASFDRLHKGSLPDEQFYDQSHFIREVSKFSGTTPKKLAQNSDDRFIQLSTLTDR